MTTTPVSITNKPEAEAVESVVRRAVVPVVLKLEDPRDEVHRELIAVPPTSHGAGWTFESVLGLLDDYQDRPDRREGTATFFDLDSFIAHALRFKSEHSAIFASPGNGSPHLTSVLDYHPSGATSLPAFGKHRGQYAFPLSDEWKTWTGKAGKGMGQQEFAEFIENHVVDVLDPATAGESAKALANTIGCSFAAPSKLLAISRDFSVNVGARVRQVQNLATGEISVQYQVEHADDKGALLKVPGAFLVGLPVFKNGTPYQLSVRLRYTVRDGSVTWRFELHRADRVFDHSFREACDKASEETGLPLFLGSPE